MAVAEAAAVLGSIKTAYDLAKGINALNVSVEVKQAVAEVLDQLLSARASALQTQESEAALLQEVRQLAAEIDRLKTWDRDRENYDLKRFHPGVLAYVPKPAMGTNEPPHRLCYGCFEESKKGVLQPTGERRMRYSVHVCTSCGKEAMMMKEEMPDDRTPEPEEVVRPAPAPYDRYTELRDD